MVDPVVASDTFTYEREKIEEWFKENNTSPVTQLPMENKNLTGTTIHQREILAYLEKNPEHYGNESIYLPKSWIKEYTDAINNKNLEAVQKCLERDRRLLTLITNFEVALGIPFGGKVSPLELACKTSSPEIVDLLINKLIQKNLLKNTKDLILDPTSLNKLLEKYLTLENYTQCELLLTLGANIEQPDGQLDTLLHRMVYANKLSSVKWLLEHNAKLESRNQTQSTPLMIAVIKQFNPIVEFLLAKKANKEARDAANATPLYTAVVTTNIALVKILLLHKVDTTVIQNSNESILHPAIAQLPMLELLLSTPAASLIDAQDSNRNTVLHKAVLVGNKEVVSFLLKKGADRKIENTAGKIPLELAKEQNKLTIVKCIKQTVKEIKKTQAEEIDKAHKIIVEQASEIKQLKQRLDEVEATELKQQKSLTSVWKRVTQQHNPELPKSILATQSVFAESKMELEPSQTKSTEETTSPSLFGFSIFS